MIVHDANLAWRAEHEVGEGPFWDPTCERLSWVDITTGELWQSPLKAWNPTVAKYEGTLGAAIPRTSDGFVLCLGGDIVLTNSTDEPIGRTSVLNDAGLRFNDAKCDSAGRLWAGSTAIDFAEGRGSLFRYDGSSVECAADGLVLPNGLGWSPDDTRFFLVDSMRNHVLHADFDATSGTIGDLSVAFETPGGLPDGLAVDSDGMLWIATWGDGIVRRYTPDGRQLAEAKVPASQCSSCCFVDSKLWITTARNGIEADEISVQPLAGSLFTVSLDGLTGVPLHRAAF